MIRFRSYRTRLQAILLLLGLTAVGIAGWQASETAATALRTATFERLMAIRETRARQIERYFQDLGNHVLALSSDEATIAAVEQFAATAPSLRGADREALQRHYNALLQNLRTLEPNVHGRIRDWFPDDLVTLALQHRFIVQNPHPAGYRFRLLAAPEAGPYGEVHTRYHPTLNRYLSAFGFYDMFLIGAQDGRLLYTVMKEVDFGTKLSESPYSATTLAGAWRRAMALPEPETFVAEDYAPYLPSNLAPAAFVAAPVYRAGNKIGVLAIQLSIRDINRIMTGDGRWAGEGLGLTGQAYLTGNDGTLRSDVRHEIEKPAQFFQELEAVGVPRDLIDRIRRYGTAVLNLKVTPGDRRSNTGVAKDFRGVEVLRSEAPLSLAGLQWRVVAEIEAEEALAAVRSLRWRMLWQALIVAIVLMAAAHFLAGNVTGPLLRLAASARRLGQRDFGVRLPVESGDEIGQLATSFNQMAEDLEHTTVSKQELDRLLNSLINAVFVVETSRDPAVDQILDGSVREVNRAGLELLRRTAVGMRFRDLLPPERTAEWHARISRLLAEGRLPADEAALLARDGTRIPVLFSASWLTEEHGRSPGLVCVAQDVSEWKIAQDKLRRMSKVFMDAIDPIVVADPDGRIVDCNVEAAQTYGWNANELSGRGLEMLFVDRCQLGELLERCLRAEAVRNVEASQVHQRRGPFPTLVSLSLLTGENAVPAGVAVISKDISDRKLAEEAIRQKRAELEALTGRLITAQEEERARLARELHDDLTQRLAAVAIEAGRLERISPDQGDRWRGMLERIKKQMMELSTEVHGLSRRLHPSMLDDLGLEAAIESECRSFFERTGTPVEFSSAGNLPPLPKETKLGLYRIAQEALRNILKHADADEVRIDLRADGAWVRLGVSDNGRGFERGAAGWHAGVGLASMEERTRLIGGDFTVKSAPGQGTQIEVTAPLRAANEKTENSAG